jgi:hypothetical protein
MTSALYICYSPADRPFVDRLVANLKAANIPVWLDAEEIDAERGSSDWRDAVEAALNDCSHMLVVLSADSVDDADVAADWNYFVGQGGVVYPVLAEDCTVPRRLKDFEAWVLHEDYPAESALLIEELKAEFSSPAGSAKCILQTVLMLAAGLVIGGVGAYLWSSGLPGGRDAASPLPTNAPEPPSAIVIPTNEPLPDVSELNAQRLTGHTDGIPAVAFSPDGDMLATGSWDGTIRLWLVGETESSAVLDGHGDKVFAVAWSPDGTALASGGADGQIILWDVETGEQIRSFEGHTDGVPSLAFSPDGEQLVSASNDGTLRLWDVERGDSLLTLEGHTDKVRSVDWSADGVLIVSGSTDSSVIIWDAASGEVIHTLDDFEYQVVGVAFSPDGTQVAAATMNGLLNVWDVETGALIHELSSIIEGLGGTLFGVSWSPDGAMLATPSWDGTIILWDAASGERIRSLGGGHGREVYDVDFSPDGSLLVSGSGDGSAIVWTLGE